MAERDGVLKRGKVWHVRTDPITRKQTSTGKRTRAEALAWLADRHAEARRRIEDPSYAAAQASFGEWCDKFIDRCKERKRSEATIGYYEQKLGHWIRILGEDATMNDVTQAAVDRFLSQRRAERAAPHTLHKECSILVRMLKVAKRGGVWFGDLDTLVPGDVTPQYEPRETALSLKQVLALIDSVKSPRLAALVAVSAALGVRRSEAAKLTREDVDLARSVVRVEGTKTKGAKADVPLVSVFRELLESALPLLPIGVPNNLYRDLETACRKAGVPYCTPNDLRRSHASILLELDVDPDTVRRILRHTSEAMLRRVYGKIGAEALGAKAERAINRRVLVASENGGQREPESEPLASVRNHENDAGNTAAQVIPARLPKPKVTRSNRVGGAPLSRQCRVSPAAWSLGYAAFSLGVGSPDPAWPIFQARMVAAFEREVA